MKTKVHAGQMSFFDLLNTEEVVESVDILTPQGSPETGTLYVSPTGEAERISANLAALRELASGGTDRDILSRYSGWGSFSGIFDEDNAKYAETRSSIIDLIGKDGYAAARAGVLDAYYTDPRVASSMWRFMYKIGFNGEMGTVLEPGCGVGVFMNGAVPGVRMTGIELDPTTAAICQRIHPDQDVIAQDYAHVRLRRNSFAGVIGNVPFGRRAPYDPEYNAGRLSIHNYFLVKSLSLLAPGGYMVCLTSRFTLDSANRAGRSAIFSLADMVGAVRLPRGSHRHCAGTDVIMDIVVFRKRCAGEEPGDNTWIETGIYRDGKTGTAINAYFLSYPEQIQGTLSIGRGMWEEDELTVTPLPGALDGPLYEDIDVALDRIAEVCRPVAPLVEESTPTIVGEASDDQPIGTLVSLSDGSFGVVTTTGVEPHKCSRNQADELRQLIALRDATAVLLSRQGAGCDDDEFDALRIKTLDMYESYVSCYGALSRRKATDRPPRPLRHPQATVPPSPLCGRYGGRGAAHCRFLCSALGIVQRAACVSIRTVVDDVLVHKPCRKITQCPRTLHVKCSAPRRECTQEMETIRLIQHHRGIDLCIATSRARPLVSEPVGGDVCECTRASEGVGYG